MPDSKDEPRKPDAGTHGTSSANAADDANESGSSTTEAANDAKPTGRSENGWNDGRRPTNATNESTTNYAGTDEYVVFSDPKSPLSGILWGFLLSRFVSRAKNS